MSGIPNQGRHSCVLVDDIAKAIESWTTTAYTPFGDPVKEQMTIVNAEGEFTEAVTFAYSRDGGTELLQANPASKLFGPSRDVGFHHFGVAIDGDLDEFIERELGAGAQLESRLYVHGHLLAAFFRPTPTRPVRFEALSVPSERQAPGI